MLTAGRAVGLTFVMGLVILFCRVFPFLFFRNTREQSGEPDRGSKRRDAFLSFVENTVPQAAMTVLAFNAVAGSFRSGMETGFPALAAALCTALVHLWKRNSLLSICGGTALYIILQRVVQFSFS
jgi:branched-subunit amino acid transport protein AzlD